MARTVRYRRESLHYDKDQVIKRLGDFYTDDLSNRTWDIEARLQRYAKYRQWTEARNDPWEDASNLALPDMVSGSLRIQDTLHNAVMAIRPALNSVAVHESDQTKTEQIDHLLDYQFFVEQGGEDLLGEMAETFTNDGCFTVFVPWIKEMRPEQDVKVFPNVPRETEPGEYFLQILNRTFPNAARIPIGEQDGWDYRLEFDDNTMATAHFYTGKEPNTVDLLIKRSKKVYDGPRVIVKDYADVLYPARAANLQPPGPSNPLGASHVILLDRPTWDEIRRLQKDGFYDLVKAEDVGVGQPQIEVPGSQTVGQGDDVEQQKDDFQGQSDTLVEKDPGHRRTTRAIIFDVYDVDGDGIGEDMIWWYLPEKKLLLKAKPMTEMYPGSPPMRPLAEAQFLPTKGRRNGIGFLELMEGLHDATKSLLDQSLDSGTLANSPFFFYRPSGSMKPEVIRLWPGEGYPLGDPARDVNFPVIPNPSQAFAINMMTIFQQMEERLSMLTDLSYGRIPAGKSSALRTVQGLQSVLGQSEARPERVLRRFFIGLSQIWQIMHRLNMHFLPQEKQYRIAGMPELGQDPYQKVSDRSQIEAPVRFEFKASLLNTDKNSRQAALGQLIQMYVSELGITAGVTDPETIWRLFRDFGRALGQEPDRKQYLKRPSPDVATPKITAEEAIIAIMNEQLPVGTPLEPAMLHLQKLIEFQKSPQFGFLTTPEQLDIFKMWLQKIADLARAQQQMLAMAAAKMQPGQGQPPQTAQQPNMANPPVQGNEVIDESLPSAQGGRLQ